MAKCIRKDRQMSLDHALSRYGDVESLFRLWHSHAYSEVSASRVFLEVQVVLAPLVSVDDFSFQSTILQIDSFTQ